MTDHPLEKYLQTVDEPYKPLVRAVHEAIRDSGVAFAVAVKYRMLMYTLENDWRHWVVAIGTSSRGVNLRFLYGVLMKDPKGLLRPGSSHLMTLDFASEKDLDTSLVTDYVKEAAGLFEYAKEHDKEL